MRIATWNCHGGFNKKIEVVERLNPDVIVIQECDEINTLSEREQVSSLWRTPGKPGSKGFGIYAMNGWSVRALATPHGVAWVIPSEIINPTGEVFARLLGMWTNVQPDIERPTYAGQFAATLEQWHHDIEQFSTFIAGDLNASIQGPSTQPHRANIAKAESLGLRSAFHHFNNQTHGEESAMTLKWVGRGKIENFYHCDFVFVPQQFQSTGSCFIDPIFDQAGKHISDHQPVVLDLPS